MSAKVYDLVVEKGATFTLKLRLKDSSGAYLDLTGYVGRMQIRSNVASPDVALDVSGSDFTFDDSGHCQIVVSAARTAVIPIAKGVYDLEIESAGGQVDRLLQGKVTISPNVTRPPGVDP